MNWELLIEIGNFAVGIIGVIGGTAGIIFWRAARKAQEAAAKEKEANAQAATIDAKSKEADLVDTILQRFEKAVIGRMDQGEAVRKQEFNQLRTDIGGQLSNIQAENRKQNETIAAQNDRIAEQSDLLQDIKDYLNGGFAEYESRKAAKNKQTKRAKKA